MKHPFLVGNQVYLRALEKEDLSGNYFQWFNDEEVCRFNSHGRFPNNMQRMEAYLLRSFTDPTLSVFAIIYQEAKPHVGNVRLQLTKHFRRACQTPIVLGEKDYWG